MKSAAYALVVPTTIDEAVAALAEHGPEARLLAGGQSLMPLMTARAVRPSVLIDLGRIPGLTAIAHRGTHVAIGAMTTQRAVERSATVVEHVPLLALAVPHLAHRTIRNQGTLGGSIAHADPSGEIPIVAVAVGAEMAIAGANGLREVLASEFFVGRNRTCLGPDEILVEVRFPTHGSEFGVGFEEVSRRPGDPAMASAAVTLHLDVDGRMEFVTVALGSVADTPIRSTSAERVLRGEVPGPGVAAAAAAAAIADLEPPSDLHATSAYRRHLAGVLLQRAVMAAVGRAQP